MSDGSIQKSYGYRYDAAGNRTNETIDTIVSQDTHNNLNQVVSRQSGTGILPIRGQADEAVSSVTVNGSAAVVRGQSFEGSASVTPGANTVTVAATDLNNNTTTKQYQVTVGGSGSATMSYDLKGNLLNDGTKTYEWDVLNRLTAINYTGSSPAQRSEFTYNGMGQRVKIVEKTGGSVVSEKRFIWIPGSPQPSEERDASNSVTKRFYDQGEQITGNSYYYNRDHLGSVRELLDSTQTLRARYEYDLYGRRSTNTVTVGPVEADFGYTGLYFHAQSSVSATFYRFYNANLGRWLSRDPISEEGGINLYSYVSNSPIDRIDPFGLQGLPAPDSLNANPVYVAEMMGQEAGMPATEAAKQAMRNALQQAQRDGVKSLLKSCKSIDKSIASHTKDILTNPNSKSVPFWSKEIKNMRIQKEAFKYIYDFLK